MTPKLIVVFARGTDEALYARRWNGNAWEDWQSLGGKLPTPYYFARQDGNDPNRCDVFVRGTDNALYHKWTEDGGATWNPGGGQWEDLGGILTSEPAGI